MDLNGLIELIRQLGFPIVVACWFMFRTDKRVDKLTAAVEKLIRREG
jgi:hypothetical protein